MLSSSFPFVFFDRWLRRLQGRLSRAPPLGVSARPPTRVKDRVPSAVGDLRVCLVGLVGLVKDQF